MKHRFLTTERRHYYHDEDYFNQYNRPNRNLTKDAIDAMEDEDSDILDDVPSRSKCPTKHRWDRRYVSHAGKRWLQSKVGQKWNDIREDFIKYTGRKGWDYLVETTTMIDGVLHINDTFGPRTLDEVWGDTYYIDNVGVLCYKPKKKYEKWKHIPKFLIHEGLVWFRRNKSLFYCIPLTAIKQKELVYVTKYYSRAFYNDGDFVFGSYEHSSHLPYPLKDKYVRKADIKQAPLKAIPEAAYELGYLDS